jgi:hypothetical protein
LGPEGPPAISQASAVEVPVSAMHCALAGHYEGYSAPEHRNGFSQNYRNARILEILGNSQGPHALALVHAHRDSAAGDFLWDTPQEHYAGL